MRKIDLIIIFSFGICLGLCELAYSWGNKKTHPALTDKAISASVINDYLKTQLGLRDGASAELKWDFPSHIKERLDKGTAEPDKTTRTILEWVKAGSVLDYGNPFENWVEKQIKANGGQCLWSGIGPVVFDKLAKYFDETTMLSSGE